MPKPRTRGVYKRPAGCRRLRALSPVPGCSTDPGPRQGTIEETLWLRRVVPEIQTDPVPVPIVVHANPVPEHPTEETESELSDGGKEDEMPLLCSPPLRRSKRATRARELAESPFNSQSDLSTDLETEDEWHPMRDPEGCTTGKKYFLLCLFEMNLSSVCVCVCARVCVRALLDKSLLC